MEFKIDSEHNKVITIPLTYADTIAKEYKYLHLVRLMDFSSQDDLYDFQLHYEAFLPVGIVVIYKEITKPNVFFYFSKRFADEIMSSNDNDYWMRGVFYYWEENEVGRIRLSAPFNPKIISNESLIHPI
ncbi:hypothetical protein [Lacibacter sp.]|uniref:hypothetical protein n=1 Tax=Lacibacter sp. TaxID=1915409 RepID=UPI002B4B6AA8|nr:hypothetical protein [Lacibacter sp.]HLP39046.1 hypothetical protein [Lacibacter sp.]